MKVNQYKLTCAVLPNIPLHLAIHFCPPTKLNSVFKPTKYYPNLHGGVRGNIIGEDVPDEAGDDHAGGGAALAHLAVEHAGRVLVCAS